MYDVNSAVMVCYLLFIVIAVRIPTKIVEYLWMCTNEIDLVWCLFLFAAVVFRFSFPFWSNNHKLRWTIDKEIHWKIFTLFSNMTIYNVFDFNVFTPSKCSCFSFPVDNILFHVCLFNWFEMNNENHNGNFCMGHTEKWDTKSIENIVKIINIYIYNRTWSWRRWICANMR